MKIKIFNREICVCALLDTNSLCAEMERKMIEEKKAYLHWLYQSVGMGCRGMLKELAKIGDGEKIYRLLMGGKLEKMLSERYRKKLPRMEAFSKGYDVLGSYEKMRARGISAVFLGEPEYPRRLAEISDAPYGLYYTGKLPDETHKSVAIIGARNCSEYGRHMARQFGARLAESGIQIVSGMARGIDGISQNAALQENGYSIGVLGCGVDICYPEENRQLYESLMEKGGICSEYPPGTMPRAILFPPRNRIISGLSDAVLVIEAKEKSGTLITVDMALEQGKEVYALPGRATDPLSKGCNRLIRQGAGLIDSVQELLQELTGEQEQAALYCQNELIFLEGLQRKVFGLLDFQPQSAEVLRNKYTEEYHETIAVQELYYELLQLCAGGYAKQIGASYFVKNGDGV